MKIFCPNCGHHISMKEKHNGAYSIFSKDVCTNCGAKIQYTFSKYSPENVIRYSP